MTLDDLIFCAAVSLAILTVLWLAVLIVEDE